MFGSKDKNDPVPTTTTTREKRVNSVIGEGANFNGTIRVEGSLVINGEFEGAVSCSDTLIVGKSGKVKADLDVQNATIAGRMDGRVFAKERVELQTGSHFTGDVHAKSFVIQDGVFFQGNCAMGDANKAGSTTTTEGKKTELGVLKQS